MIINSDWTFKKVGSDKKIKVDLPYDAMLRENRSINAPGGDRVSYFLGGDYIYEKALSFNEEELKDKTIYLRFEGVYHDPKIYINEVIAYQRNYGYSDFIFDATSFFKAGENTIKVTCINSDQPNSRWYSGAGIYRDVHLYVLPKEHILPRSFKISTIDYKTGKVKVTYSLTSSFEVELKVLDKEDKEVFVTKTDNKSPEVEFEIPDFKLWSVDSPYLYTFILSYKDGYEKKRFGLRNIELSKEKGLLLNGIRTPLFGACIHSDNGLLGAETYKDVEKRKAEILKRAGYNSIRSAHNPIVESFIDACDELGLLIMDEYVDCWYIHKTEYDYASHTLNNYKEDLKDMVDKDFSHPSVILYSTGNEVGETAFNKGIEFTKELTDTLHEYDSSRPVTCGINVFFNGIAHSPFTVYSDKKAKKPVKEKKIKEKKESKNKKPTGSSDIYNAIANFFGQNFMKYGAKIHLVDKHTRDAFANMDIAGYNYGIKRYKKDLKKYKDRFILGTETFLNDAGGFYDLYMNNPRIIGDFVWSGMDYLGEAGFSSWANATDYDFKGDPSGWITDGGGRININGDPLSEMDYQRVCYHLTPVAIGAISPHDKECKAHPAAWKFSRALPSYSFNGYEGKKTEIEIYTYGKYVKLYLNNKFLKSFKNKKNKNHFSYKMRYIPGTIKAVAYDENNNIIGESSLTSATGNTLLCLESEKQSYRLDEKVFVHVKYKDDNNIDKVLHNREVEIISIENGELLRYGTAARWNKSSYFSNKCMTYYGRSMMIIKPISLGQMKITVKDSDDVISTITINITD